MKKSISILATIISVYFWSCDKSEVLVEPLAAQTVKNIAADPTVSLAGQPVAATGKYALFSFANGIIANSDSATTKWDIGFRGTTIMLNGGTSGPGQAGVIVKDGLFDDFKEITETSFVQDAKPAFGIPTGSGKGWYNYNTTNNIITPIPGKVFLVKTADGKYAKFEVVSYYKDAPATIEATTPARFYTIRYIYQPDGSKKLI